MNRLEIKKKSKKLIDISLNHFFVVLLGCVVMLLFGSISYATEEETDLLLDRFFDYADNYYNMDFSNNTDIHSTNFQNFLSFIHYNKQQIKAKFYSYKNESTENLENYSEFNGIAMICWYNSFNIILFKTPNTLNYNNYGYKEYRGQWYQTVAYYKSNFNNRLSITVDGNGNINLNSYSTTDTSVNLSSYQSWDYGNPMNFSLVMYKDNNYYSSVPNFNGNASYFINNSNARVNGLSDYGFFNINYNNIQRIDVDEDIVFGDLYVGYNYSLNNQTIYLYNETTSQIMNNEIDLIPIGGLYNGRYHYQVVTEDLENLNSHNQYRLICSSSSPILAAFTSDKFKFEFKNEEPGQELPYIMILSGDYDGVGSGDGFNKAINDINNNIGVIGNKVDKINNTITDNSKVEEPFNDLLSGDSSSVLNNLGITQIENPYNDFLLRIFYSIMNTFETSQNVTITLPMRDGLENSYIILNSDDFNHNNVILKVFLSSVIIFFIIYNTYKKFADVISHLSDFDMTKLQVAIDQILYDEVRYF